MSITITDEIAKKIMGELDVVTRNLDALVGRVNGTLRSSESNLNETLKKLAAHQNIIEDEKQQTGISGYSLFFSALLGSLISVVITILFFVNVYDGPDKELAAEGARFNMAWNKLDTATKNKINAAFLKEK